MKTAVRRGNLHFLAGPLQPLLASLVLFSYYAATRMEEPMSLTKMLEADHVSVRLPRDSSAPDALRPSHSLSNSKQQHPKQKTLALMKQASSLRLLLSDLHPAELWCLSRMPPS